MTGSNNHTDSKQRCLLCAGKEEWPEEARQELESNSKEVTYEAGETVIKQGTFASHIFCLKQGLVKVVLESGNDKRVALQMLTSGTFFGLPFLEGEYFHFGAEAMKRSAICQIRKEAFREVIDRNPEAWRYLREWYSRNYLDLFHKLEINSTRNSHGKLAATLYTLCGDAYQGEDVFACLSRGDLAELSSISRESTNKILKELENDRIIRIEQDRFEVLQPALLQRLSLIG